MQQIDALVELARATFTDLTDGEDTLLRNAASGGRRASGTMRWAGFTVESSSYPSDENAFVRAEIIRWLCSDKDALSRIDARGVYLSNARLIGKLDLSFLKIPFPLSLLDCFLIDGADLVQSELPKLELTGSQLRNFNCQRLSLSGSLMMMGVVVVGSRLKLEGIRLGGNLWCDRARLENPLVVGEPGSGIAVSGERSVIGGSASFLGAHIKGAFNFNLANVEGRFTCDRAVFENPLRDLNENTGAAYYVSDTDVNPEDVIGTALSLESAKIHGPLLLRRCRILGLVNLNYVVVGGALECDRATIDNRPVNAKAITNSALSIQSASITGPLLLRSEFRASGAVDLYNSRIGGDLDCSGATFSNPSVLGIDRSGVALRGNGLSVGGAALLNKNAATGKVFSAEGAVYLFRAKIGTFLSCEGGTFSNPPQSGPNSGSALIAGGLETGGDVLLRNNFAARGRVTFYGAQIRGNFDCDDALFDNPSLPAAPTSGLALQLEAAHVGGSVLFRRRASSADGCGVNGTFNLRGTAIDGGIDCDGISVRNPRVVCTPQSGLAIQAYGVTVKGNVLLRRGFSAKGSIIFASSRIGGEFNLSGASIEDAPVPSPKEGGTALDLSRARIAGDVSMRVNTIDQSQFTAIGLIRLSGAQIEGHLDCDGGQFENPTVAEKDASKEDSGGVSIQADALSVGKDARLRKGFRAKGLVILFGARVAGSLDCSGGSFANNLEQPPEWNGRTISVGAKTTCLEGTHMHVETDVLLTGTSCVNKVRLRRAKIGGRLELNGSTFAALDLSDVVAGSIADNVDQGGWEASRTKLQLDGFEYERIAGGHNTPAENVVPIQLSNRLHWLRLQERFTRQPYLRLAKVLKAAGHEKAARRVHIEMETRAVESENLSRRAWALIMRRLIGYGYAPHRAAYWVIGLIIVGALVYWNGWRTMVPTQTDAYKRSMELDRGTLPNYGRFHALWYSIDNSFPLVKLGAQDKWIPNELSAPKECVESGLTCKLERSLVSPVFLRWFRLFQVCMGWFLPPCSRSVLVA